MGKDKKPDSGVSAEKLLKAYKGKIGQEILDGKTDLAGELIKLDRHEKSSSRPAPSSLEKLRPRRRYTLSPEALEQRRNAAENSTGPTTAEGKRSSRKNAVKYGLYASSFLLKFGKPCKSTCPQFADCEMVKEGGTRPGAECLDRAHLIEMLDAFSAALDGDTEGIKDMMAVELAGAQDVVRQMREEIAKYGTLVKEEELDENGKVVRTTLKLNPLLNVYPRLLAEFGITMPAWNLTEREVLKNKTDEKAAETAASIFSGLVDKARRAREAK